ncbi:hypothetical protein H0H93_008606 [Arthromyces matolae]|nr:hypothetical protein H0H93_008606 [Arthromyces matolae]
MDAAALLGYVLSQTKQNIEFLVAQKQISKEIGNEILAKIPKAPSAADALAKQTQNLSISSPTSAAHGSPSSHGYEASYSSPPGYGAPPAAAAVHTAASATTPGYGASYTSLPSNHPPPAVAAPTTHVSTSVSSLPPGVLFRAKALWDYNEHGQNTGDLPFRAGDIIDITAETNADWWTGRNNGRDGLFPSNYVERLPPPQGPHPAHSIPPPAPHAGYSSPPPGGAPLYGTTPGYSSYPPPAAPGGYGAPSAFPQPGGYAPPAGGYAPMGGYQGPPPPGPAYTPYGTPGAPSHGAPGKEGKAGKEHKEGKDKDKKNKGGGLGETLAHAAVGGVGFGAGSAIGSGIIDSLF